MVPITNLHDCILSFKLVISADLLRGIFDELHRFRIGTLSHIDIRFNISSAYFDRISREPLFDESKNDLDNRIP